MNLGCFMQRGTKLDAIGELASGVRKGINVSLTSFSSHVGSERSCDTQGVERWSVIVMEVTVD